MKKTLSKAVKDKRLEKNLSLEKAVKQIGICYVTYWKIENGYTKISYETILKLAKFLEISESEIRNLL